MNKHKLNICIIYLINRNVMRMIYIYIYNNDDDNNIDNININNNKLIHFERNNNY